MEGDLDKKLMLVGDSGSGKTCLLSVFINGHFPEDNFRIIVAKSHRAQVKVDGNQVKLDIWDTAGLEDYVKRRSSIYTEIDAIIMCFSVNNQISLENIPKTWTPEVRHFRPDVPIVLVGCKKDLRGDVDTPQPSKQRGLTAVSYEKGKKMADGIGARAYIECSARLKENVREVFEIASRETVGSHDQQPKQPTGCCTLL